METKNIKELSNIELSLYKKELEAQYESLKIKINKMCDELDALDKEYSLAQKEEKIRQTRVF